MPVCNKNHTILMIITENTDILLFIKQFSAPWYCKKSQNGKIDLKLNFQPQSISTKLRKNWKKESGNQGVCSEL